jgi:acyl carrier protein
MSIETRVINIINEELGVDAKSEDTFDDLYADSLDLVEIITECEQEFGYPITDDKVQNLKTVGDLVNLITDLDVKDYIESTQADLQVDE